MLTKQSLYMFCHVINRIIIEVSKSRNNCVERAVRMVLRNVGYVINDSRGGFAEELSEGQGGRVGWCCGAGRKTCGAEMRLGSATLKGYMGRVAAGYIRGSEITVDVCASWRKSNRRREQG